MRTSVVSAAFAFWWAQLAWTVLAVGPDEKKHHSKKVPPPPPKTGRPQRKNSKTSPPPPPSTSRPRQKVPPPPPPKKGLREKTRNLLTRLGVKKSDAQQPGSSTVLAGDDINQNAANENGKRVPPGPPPNKPRKPPGPPPRSLRKKISSLAKRAFSPRPRFHHVQDSLDLSSRPTRLSLSGRPRSAVGVQPKPIEYSSCGWGGAFDLDLDELHFDLDELLMCDAIINTHNDQTNLYEKSPPARLPRPNRPRRESKMSSSPVSKSELARKVNEKFAEGLHNEGVHDELVPFASTAGEDPSEDTDLISPAKKLFLKRTSSGISSDLDYDEDSPTKNRELFQQKTDQQKENSEQEQFKGKKFRFLLIDAMYDDVAQKEVLRRVIFEPEGIPELDGIKQRQIALYKELHAEHYAQLLKQFEEEDANTSFDSATSMQSDSHDFHVIDNQLSQKENLAEYPEKQMAIAEEVQKIHQETDKLLELFPAEIREQILASFNSGDLFSPSGSSGDGDIASLRQKQVANEALISGLLQETQSKIAQFKSTNGHFHLVSVSFDNLVSEFATSPIDVDLMEPWKYHNLTI